MIREILFRGKTNQNRWVYGSPLIGKDTTPIMNFWRGEGFAKTLDWVYVYPETIGQYTGLKDKDGKKIFEGDIVRTKDSFFYNDGNYKIVYVKGGFIAEDKDESEEVTFGKDVSLDDFEVIGNIHDNPELLKGGD